MWMIAANFRRTHSPSRLAWSEGWRPPGAQSTFIRWTGWTLAMTGHDDSTINIDMAIIIIIIIIITLRLGFRRFEWRSWRGWCAPLALGYTTVGQAGELCKLCKLFSANPPYRSLSFFSFRIHYVDFPDCLLLLLSISVFLLFSFSVFTLF